MLILMGELIDNIFLNFYAYYLLLNILSMAVGDEERIFLACLVNMAFPLSILLFVGFVCVRR